MTLPAFSRMIKDVEKVPEKLPGREHGRARCLVLLFLIAQQGPQEEGDNARVSSTKLLSRTAELAENRLAAECPANNPSDRGRPPPQSDTYRTGFANNRADFSQIPLAVEVLGTPSEWSA